MGLNVFGGVGWRLSVSCPRPTGIQCWIDEGRVGRVRRLGTVLVECSEVLRILNFRTYFFPTVLDVLLDVNNVGVSMKARRHSPHDFPRRGEKGRTIFIYLRKERKISASSPTTLGTLVLFLSPQGSLTRIHLSGSTTIPCFQTPPTGGKYKFQQRF